MQWNRAERIGHLVQMELGRALLFKVKDPRIGFVTITHVHMAADLKSACVFYSVLGGEKERRDSQEALEHARGFLQKEIALQLKLRYTPKLKFQEDDSLRKGMEIDQILAKIRSEQRPAES